MRIYDVSKGEAIVCDYNGETLLGKFVTRSATYLKVEITYPYIKWPTETIPTDISELDLTTKRDFLSEPGIRKGPVLLARIYAHLKFVDENIEKMAVDYQDFIASFGDTDKLIDENYHDRIMDKIYAWFFNVQFMVPRVTGYFLTPPEVRFLKNVFEFYINENVKIYEKQ